MEIISRRVVSLSENNMAMDRLMPYGIALVFGLLILVAGLSIEILEEVPLGPFGWPLVGHLFRGGKHPHRVFGQLPKRYGSVFFGSVRVVIVSDGDMAKEVFSVSNAKVTSRPIHDFLSSLSKYMNYGDENVTMVFCEYSPRVRERRQLCISELFTLQKMEVRKSTREEEILRVVGKLQELAKGSARNSPIELTEYCPSSVSPGSEFPVGRFLTKSFCISSGFYLPTMACIRTFQEIGGGKHQAVSGELYGRRHPSIRPPWWKFNVQEVHIMWKHVSAYKESCTSAVLHWHREHFRVELAALRLRNRQLTSWRLAAS